MEAGAEQGETDQQLSESEIARAWWSITSRPKQAGNGWSNQLVIEAIRRVVTSGDFNDLLNEAAVARWNELATGLMRTVSAELLTGLLTGQVGGEQLGSEQESSEQVVEEYVRLNVRDCLYLPSESAMSAFVQSSQNFQRIRGYRRDIAAQRFGQETYHPASGSANPRVVLHDALGQTLLEFINFWPNRSGFTSIPAVLDSANTVIVLDVPAREEELMDADFLADCGALAGAWRQLLKEHQAYLYQAGMRHSHEGLADFPATDATQL
ncbi:hypothetical protein [Psychromicrobium lacuslunae]|uniref:Uncharacterized protein n=1 Tax=Psychromicrobium lacuslunae TaxID=1618207 RepID=A0A0D4BXX6_9MICC|nr:hypothetical protein [Psychromicrobium lacuslunae]AJT40971.1 hypothetical protein UM93_04605 [Psychromicrobium lacuslunae]